MNQHWFASILPAAGGAYPDASGCAMRGSKGDVTKAAPQRIAVHPEVAHMPNNGMYGVPG